MGQTSSQQEDDIRDLDREGEAIPKQAEYEREKHKRENSKLDASVRVKKKKKREEKKAQRNTMKGPRQKEGRGRGGEGAGQLKADWQALSYDNDVAASIQLQQENSSSQHVDARGGKKEHGEYSKRSTSLGQDELSAKGERKRRYYENCLNDENMMPDLLDWKDGPEQEQNFKRKRRKHNHSHHSSSLDRRLRGPQTMQSLDDIDSNDEAISTYLREYNNELVRHSNTPTLMPNGGTIESEPQMQELVATIDRGHTDPAGLSAYDLPPLSSSSPVESRKIREKGTRHSSYGVEDGDPAGHEGSNGTGQHDFDLAAFDSFFNNLSDSANLAVEATELDSHIDPGLTQTCREQTSAPDINVVETSRHKGKPPEIHLSDQIRRSVEEPDYSEPIGFVQNSSPELGEGLNGRALLGTEGMGNQYTSGGGLFNTAGPSEETTKSDDHKSIEPASPDGENRGSNLDGEYSDRGRQGTKKVRRKVASSEFSQTGGKFTAAEIAKLDAFRNAYCEEEGMTAWQFNQFVHSPVQKKPRAKELWDRIHELIPYRRKVSVTRFCKRRYHNFAARGTWTQSEDESLRRAVAEKGKAWTKVGKMIDRFPEDCRDRYRNYHVNAENRNKEQWSQAEVKNLCKAVYDCLKKVEGERNLKRDEYYDNGESIQIPTLKSEVDELKLINWQAVSDRMGITGGTRSRLQCSHKWSSLKKVDVEKHWRGTRVPLKTQKNSAPTKVSKKKGTSWRLDRAKKKLHNMRAGDRHDFLQALATCGAVEVENIPWKMLGNEEFRARWSTVERKAAWEIFKAEVPGSEKMYYLDVVNRLLTSLLAKGVNNLRDRWDLEIHGSTNSKSNKAQKSRKSDGIASTGKRVNKALKSAEHIANSDDDPDVLESGSTRAGERGVGDGQPDNAIHSNLFIASDDDENRHRKQKSHGSSIHVPETNGEKEYDHSYATDEDSLFGHSSAEGEVVLDSANEQNSPDVPSEAETDESKQETKQGGRETSEELADSLQLLLEA